MVNLHLGIDDNDVRFFEFISKHKLVDYLWKFFEEDKFHGVWIMANNGKDMEILVSEKLNKCILALEYGMFENNLNDIYLFLEESYEEAYDNVMDLREPNKLCYKEWV